MMIAIFDDDFSPVARIFDWEGKFQIGAVIFLVELFEEMYSEGAFVDDNYFGFAVV